MLMLFIVNYCNKNKSKNTSPFKLDVELTPSILYPYKLRFKKPVIYNCYIEFKSETVYTLFLKNED